METRLSTGGDGVWQVEAVLPAEVGPIGLLVGWQYERDGNGWAGSVERLYGVHQHWLAADGHELLGQVAAHAQPPSPGHDYGKELTVKAGG